MKTINSKIKYTYLGIDEDNVMSLYLGFEFKENGYWLGAKTNDIILLDLSLIKEVLNVLEVKSWEELPRKFARIQLENGKVIAIGNLLEDKWVEVK